MDSPYLIEIRIQGDIKDLCKKLIYDIFHKFKVYSVVKRRPVPHISLFGPFDCQSTKSVIDSIKEVGSKYSKLEYQVKGFDYFESKKKFLFITTSTKKNVICLKINPSDELMEFRYALAQKLLLITETKKIDQNSKEKFQFHITLAMKDIDSKFEDIWEYLKKYNLTKYGTSYRITLIKDRKIFYEYDLYNKKVLNRDQVMSKFRRK